MNAIDSAVSQVMAAQQAALKSRTQMAVEATRLDMMRLKGDTVNEMLRATDASARREGRGRWFNGTA